MRSVWSRVARRSMTVVRPAAFRPARRIADLTWADGDRGVVFDRHRLGRARDDERQPAAVARGDFCPGEAQRVRHPVHRTGAQRMVAGHEAGDRMAREHAEQQARRRCRNCPCRARLPVRRARRRRRPRAATYRHPIVRPGRRAPARRRSSAARPRLRAGRGPPSRRPPARRAGPSGATSTCRPVPGIGRLESLPDARSMGSRACSRFLGAVEKGPGRAGLSLS